MTYDLLLSRNIPSITTFSSRLKPETNGGGGSFPSPLDKSLPKDLFFSLTSTGVPCQIPNYPPVKSISSGWYVPDLPPSDPDRPPPNDRSVRTDLVLPFPVFSGRTKEDPSSGNCREKHSALDLSVPALPAQGRHGLRYEVRSLGTLRILPSRPVCSGPVPDTLRGVRNV